VTAPAPVPGDGRPRGRLAWAGVAAGWAVMVVGVVGLLADGDRTRPANAARFVLGAALVHDLLLAPLVVAIGLAVNRLAPRRWRPVAQGALIVSGVAVLFSWPFVRGYGRVSANPSILPGDYGAGLATVLAAVWVVAALLVLAGRRRRR
jgi:hypothetical protein